MIKIVCDMCGAECYTHVRIEMTSMAGDHDITTIHTRTRFELCNACAGKITTVIDGDDGK